MSKLFQSEWFTAMASELLDLAGPDGTPPGHLEHAFRHSTVTTIYGGSSEVQRGIIAERGLGSPAPGRPRARPCELDAVVAFIAAAGPARPAVHLRRPRARRHPRRARRPDTRPGPTPCGRSPTTTVRSGAPSWSSGTTTLGRSWILGPWVAGDDATWRATAPVLLDAALDQLPERRHPPRGVRRRVARAARRARRQPGLAPQRGQPRPGGRPGDDRGLARSARPTIRTADGPTTSRSSGRCTTPSSPTPTPARTSCWPWTAGTTPGWCSSTRAWPATPPGRCSPTARGTSTSSPCAPDARGRGVGRRLVVALSRDLLAACRTGRVNLTVAERRTDARALYERLGFRADESFVAYRSWTG